MWWLHGANAIYVSAATRLHPDNHDSNVLMSISVSTLVVMEVPRIAPLPQINDLFVDECSVPTHDPASPISQPRTAAGRILQKRFPKLISRISLRPVRSAESDSTAAASQGNGSSNQGLNGSHTQHLGDRVIPDKAQGRDLKLKIFFWKRGQTKAAVQLPNGTPVQPISGTTATLSPVSPSLVVDDYAILPATTGPERMNVVHQASTLGPTVTVSPALLEPASPLPILQQPSVDQTQSTDTTSTFSTQTVSRQPNLPTASREIHAVLEPVESVRLDHPEKGIYVGKLKELPPPAQLREEWRSIIRPELIKNLRMVIGSLPKNLSVPETRVEPELCMSGVVTRGQPMVSLRPTIWLRCGSEQCRRAVQRTVADLSHVQRFNVHVTLQAPRLSSSDRQVPFGISRATAPSSEHAVDQILPVEPAQPAITANRNIEGLTIQVESLRGNQRSACGLRVQLSAPDGTTQTCTLGGMLMLDEIMVGLTTAHAIHGLGVDASQDKRRRMGHERRAHTGAAADPADESLVSATVWAAHFGDFVYVSGEVPAKSVSLADAACHDFALLKLHPTQIEPAWNSYDTPDGPQYIDTTSQDVTARQVQLVCSVTDVKSGYLLEDDCVFVDRAGYWETRKIQLDAPLGKSL
jgi:hypothetical protein